MESRKMTSQRIDAMKQDMLTAISARIPEMTQPVIKMLDTLLVGRRVNKWETIVNEGDVSNSIIFVAKGMMRQYYYKNGKDITEHFTYENGILTCLESFFNRTPSRIIVEAIEPAVVFEFFYDDIQRLIEMSPAMNRFYMAMLQEALIISQQKSDASRFESARQRYIRLLNEHPEIVKRASMNQIASYLVMTPETLSRIRSAL